MVLKNKLVNINFDYKKKIRTVSLCLAAIEYADFIEFSDFDFLNCSEKKYLRSNISNLRRISYVCGRYAAKKAVNSLDKGFNLRDIYVENGVFKHPVLKNKELDITISHAENYSVSLAFSRNFVFGIDIEKTDGINIDSLARILDIRELEMLTDIEQDLHKKLLLLWALKEALGKCLKTGININLDILGVRFIKKMHDYFEGEFLNFPQYKFIVFAYENFYISIVFPKYIDFSFDVNKFIKLPFGF